MTNYRDFSPRLGAFLVALFSRIQSPVPLSAILGVCLCTQKFRSCWLTRRYQPIAKNYFFLAPARVMLLIASGARPDFSAISRPCSIMKPRAGLSFSRWEDLALVFDFANIEAIAQERRERTTGERDASDCSSVG
jgi:hypothetical protein